MTDEQIKELFDTVPAVADSCIESLRPAPFLRSISRCLSASVNTGLIYGTVNPNYPGMTWRELFDKGEKMRKNIRLFTVNPEYYLNLERFRAPFMSFCFHEGKGYVAEDGCHRACIAKFFLYSQPSPFLCGVHFTEVQTDARMTNLFYRLKKLLPVWCAAFPNSQEVTRNDDAKEWSMSFYRNTLRIENHHRKGFNADFQAEELEEGLLPALLNPFKRRFGMYRNLLN